MISLSRSVARANKLSAPCSLVRAYSSEGGAEKKRVQSPFEKVTIFGSGLMGSGIAQVSATYNHSVKLVDLNETALEKSQKYIMSSLKRVAKKKFPESTSDQVKFCEGVISKIQFTTKAEEAASDADLVLEAIVENVEIKRKLVATVDAVAPNSVVFATNTSSLKVGDIFANISEARRPNVGGLHFFNPVPQMKLLEVVKADTTSQETFDKMFNYGLSIGKVCVSCKDTPGFIVNRLLVPYMLEAMRMVERGDATAKDIDSSMKYGAGYPMGPFELADYVGLDTSYFISNGWYTNSELKGNDLVKPPKNLKDLVDAGRFGTKSGAGFYDYTKK
ncbi:putative 3-hydroxyacyl-CoA dehydrogenase [Zancudomyces culisetae]|uniref:3-hydroxyacyl-CoA dehydrogenase n=1 Tax=Zancudomyces culisetae TaxID=1213189 RepID=A0A1R1PFY1_ZANCU|nr:putative 3-hydroxyacyl-CoA dehydrogenase [Zancudomyces culisetae]|eukprot:OMH79856.1 putative 3-hydroxyacyl-CoA dehydrogenase [Zancudomyces culisetae]